MFKRVVCVAALLMVSISAAQSQPAEDVVPLYTLADTTPSIVEIIELSSQVNDRVLQTVHWSLGVVVTVLAVIMGFNWFVGMRSFERDREALNATIAAELVKLDSRITQRLDEHERASEVKVSESADLLSSNVQEGLLVLEASFQRFESQVNSKLDASRSQIEGLMSASADALGERIDGEVSALKSAIDQGESAFKSQIEAVRKSFELFEMDMNSHRWKIEGVAANELTYRAKYVLELIRRNHSEYVIISQLTRVEELIAQGAHRNSPDAANRLVNQLPDQYSIQRDRIGAILRD